MNSKFCGLSCSNVFLSFSLEWSLSEDDDDEEDLTVIVGGRGNIGGEPQAMDFPQT